MLPSETGEVASNVTGSDGEAELSTELTVWVAVMARVPSPRAARFAVVMVVVVPVATAVPMVFVPLLSVTVAPEMVPLTVNERVPNRVTLSEVLEPESLEVSRSTLVGAVVALEVTFTVINCVSN